MGAEDHQVQAEAMAAPFTAPKIVIEESTAPLETEIRTLCAEMAEFLVEKNRAYGNSAAEPAGIFAKRLDPLAQIDVRIDDKINRLQKGSEYPGDDTVKDLAGYLLLRMVVSDLVHQKDYA